MIDYKYLAKTSDGVVQTGTVEADSVSAASKLLTSKDLFPINIYREEKSSFDIFKRVSIKDKAFLMRQLATMINAGLPIAQALKTLSEQITNKKLIVIIEQVIRDVEGGSPLSVSFGKFPNVFNPTEVTLLSSGEASGTLDKVLTRLATSIEGEYKITRKIKTAMAYPLFIIAVVTVVLIIMSVFIMPKMEELYASFNAKLPIFTRAILFFANNIYIFALILLAIGTAIYFVFKAYTKTDEGKYNWDNVKINMPVIGMFLKSLYLSRFTRTLAVLVSSGVSIIDSLNIVSKAIGNKVYEMALQDAIKKVKTGIPLSTPLKSNKIFPPVVSQMIRVGEQTGELDNMLTNLSDFYDDEVDAYVKSLSSVIEPLLVVVMGIIVGVILISIMMPLYQIGRVIV